MCRAQGKDVGLIATTNGWNLYLGGNGGANPAHGRLFVKDASSEDIIRYIDRYLMYYIRTADKLQRTARWLEDLDEEHGDGLAHLQSVLIEDSLGVCEDLERDMQRHVDSYEDEWAATLRDERRLRRFRAFINEPNGSDEGFAPVRAGARADSPRNPRGNCGGRSWRVQHRPADRCQDSRG